MSTGRELGLWRSRHAIREHRRRRQQPGLARNFGRHFSVRGWKGCGEQSIIMASQIQEGSQRMDEELMGRIVDELARHRSRNDIIQMLCEQEGLNWPDAEQLVKQVEAEQAHTIAGKQSPLIILLSTAIVAAGIGILYFTFPGIPVNYHGDLLGTLLILADYPFMFGILGLSMIAGGLIGMYSHLLHYFAT